MIVTWRLPPWSGVAHQAASGAQRGALDRVHGAPVKPLDPQAFESCSHAASVRSPVDEYADDRFYRAGADAARASLDAWVREVVAWHFDPATGCPFWLEWAEKAGWDPRKEVERFDDLRKFGHFEDEWLRGGPVRRWVPRAYADKPIFVFETGGTTGIPKSRIAIDDFRTDYELFSDTLPDECFPKGANWLIARPERGRGGCVWRWSIWRSTAAASASASTSTRAG